MLGPHMINRSQETAAIILMINLLSEVTESALCVLSSQKWVTQLPQGQQKVGTVKTEDQKPTHLPHTNVSN